MRNVVFYNTKSSPSWDESGLRSGGCGDDDFVVGLSSNYRRIVFLLAEAFRELALNLELPDFVAGALFGEVAG